MTAIADRWTVSRGPVRATVTDAHGRAWPLTGDRLAGLTAYDLWARTRLAQARAVEEFPRP